MGISIFCHINLLLVPLITVVNYLSIIGKWNKTALIYAVKNGHSPVVAYLLRIGVDPCAADTSGNTPVHYAAAYGWLHCLKMLVKAGADPNVANQWKASSGHESSFAELM